MKKTTLQICLLISLTIPAVSFAGNATSTSSDDVTMSTSTMTASSTEEMTPFKSFTVCSQEAIEQRDSSIASSRSIYNTAMNNALTMRKNSEKDAIALDDQDEKKDAIKLSVDTYKHQTREAQAALTAARKEIWQTFDQDVKTCRESEKEQAELEQATLMAEATTTRLQKSSIPETKSLRETIKTQIENFISLFN